MDEIDHRIIRALRADGRISNADLAGKVGCRPPPATAGCGCWRRAA